VAFRDIFEDTVRDHAVGTFVDAQTSGPIHRVSVDDWKTDACPHHGPTPAIAADGTYHVAWFTNGRARKGLFYALSHDGGRQATRHQFKAELFAGSHSTEDLRLPLFAMVRVRRPCRPRESPGNRTLLGGVGRRFRGGERASATTLSANSDKLSGKKNSPDCVRFAN
jgi:hypothetical protein